MIDKPVGKFKCLACGTICDGSQLWLDPQCTSWRWTCSDVFCGGTAVKIDPTSAAPNESLTAKRDASVSGAGLQDGSTGGAEAASGASEATDCQQADAGR